MSYLAHGEPGIGAQLRSERGSERRSGILRTAALPCLLWIWAWDLGPVPLSCPTSHTHTSQWLLGECPATKGVVNDGVSRPGWTPHIIYWTSFWSPASGPGLRPSSALLCVMLCLSSLIDTREINRASGVCFIPLSPLPSCTRRLL